MTPLHGGTTTSGRVQGKVQKMSMHDPDPSMAGDVCHRLVIESPGAIRQPPSANCRPGMEKHATGKVFKRAIQLDKIDMAPRIYIDGAWKSMKNSHFSRSPPASSAPGRRRRGATNPSGRKMSVGQNLSKNDKFLKNALTIFDTSFNNFGVVVFAYVIDLSRK